MIADLSSAVNYEQITIDGNEAAAHVAFKTNEIITIYPITPSSPMGEFADAWATSNEKNIWRARDAVDIPMKSTNTAPSNR